VLCLTPVVDHPGIAVSFLMEHFQWGPKSNIAGSLVEEMAA
jgi:hypothetical protein